MKNLFLSIVIVGMLGSTGCALLIGSKSVTPEPRSAKTTETGTGGAAGSPAPAEAEKQKMTAQNIWDILLEREVEKPVEKVKAPTGPLPPELVKIGTKHDLPVSTLDQSADKFGTAFMAAEIGANMWSKNISDASATTKHQYPSSMSVVITTFVDLNDLARTSVFGRMVAEKMIDEMNRLGFTVVELRRAQDIFVKKDGGEFILSRDVEAISKTTSASALLAGTYVVTPKTILINARLMDIKSPKVISTVSLELLKTAEIESMLRGPAQ